MLCVLVHDCHQTCNNRNMSQCTLVQQGRLLRVPSELCFPVGMRSNNMDMWWLRCLFHGQQKVDWWYWCPISKAVQVLFGGLMPGWSTHGRQLSRWCPAAIISQMASRSTLTLSWSWGEKRCRTSLGLCWWKAARPIRCHGVSHHVTASPIAIYFTIGQMKRLILTICSLMCFFLSHSLFVTLPLFFSLSFPLSPPPWLIVLPAAAGGDDDKF